MKVGYESATALCNSLRYNDLISSKYYDVAYFANRDDTSR